MNIGHYAHIVARQERIRAFQEARGMSPVALQRLPQSPRIQPPVYLPVVLATKANGTDLAQSRRAKAQWRKPRPKRKPVRAARDATKAVELPKAVPLLTTHHVKAVTPFNVINRMRAIAAIVAGLFNLEPYQLLNKGRERRFVRPRQIAIRVALETTRLAPGRVGEAFSMMDRTTITYHGRRGIIECAANPELAAKYEEACRIVRERWGDQ